MIGQLKQMVTGRRAGPQASRAQVLGARPVRNPLVGWERYAPVQSEDEPRPEVVLLQVPRRADKWGNFVARMFKLPTHRKIELDEMGSDVWEMCDGSASVEALTKAVCAKYRLNRRQGEASVTAYLRMLAERRLVALKNAASGAGKSSATSSPQQQSTRKRKPNERSSPAASGRR